MVDLRPTTSNLFKDLFTLRNMFVVIEKIINNKFTTTRLFITSRDAPHAEHITITFGKHRNLTYLLFVALLR